MKDRILEQIRERDKSFGESIPDHWQGPKDRRYLLSIIDTLLKGKPVHSCIGMCDNYPDGICG